MAEEGKSSPIFRITSTTWTHATKDNALALLEGIKGAVKDDKQTGLAFPAPG